MALSAGERLGVYEILAPLGAGGMGEVYRARDTKLRRDVAIKVLPASLAQHPDRLARFEREAKVLAALNHPNIAAIYGLEDRAIVMELVEGPTLAERLAARAIPLEESLRIAAQIADALEAAHEKGIVHRDLKPANVKAPLDGPVKVLDLGLATALPGAQREGSDIQNSPTLTIGGTEAGLILGTATYMSPEQASGRGVDKRADIWSFGAVLWEMLTGKLLFGGGETVSHVLADVLRAPIDFTPVEAKAPPPIAALVKRCLDRNVKTRLRDIGEARVAIANYLADPESGAEAPRQAKAPAVQRVLWAAAVWAAAGGLAVAIVGAAALWLRPDPLPKVTRFEIHAPPGASLPLGIPAISSDGSTLAYTVADADGIRRIHIRQIDRVETRAVPGTEGAIYAFWAPDGRSLAFSVNLAGQPTLARVDLAGGAARELAQVSGPWHGAWNQHGDILFLRRTVMRIPAEGGAAVVALNVNQQSGERDGGFPVFLPDGKRFLVNVLHNETRSIQLASLDSDKRSMVLDHVDSAPLLASTPRGKSYLLYLRGADLFGQEFDERSGAVRGKPVVVINNVGRVATPAVRPAVGVSSSGILAFQRGTEGQNGQLTWYDRSGKPVEALPGDASGVNPELSPDGLYVAMLKQDSSGNQSLWLTDLRRQSATRISFNDQSDVLGAWSPDSKRVAIANLRGLHIINIDDPAKVQNMESTGAPTSWSPDNKYVLLSPRGQPLSLVPIGDKDLKPIPAGSRNGLSSQGRISPDGKRIAFTSTESGRPEIYLQPMPPGAGQQKVSIKGGVNPRWRRDGKEIFFVSPDNAMMAAEVHPDGAVGVPQELFRLKDPDIRRAGYYDVRADGNQFLIFTPTASAQESTITVVLNWWAEFWK